MTPLTFRLIIRDPVPGVELRVQSGRTELLPPVERGADATTFEVTLSVEVRADGTVAVRGPVVQGPPAGRFMYVNAGTYAGQALTSVGRRAKVPLGGLDADLVRAALAEPQRVVVGEIGGRARDGGPAAATVSLLGDGWRVEPRPRTGAPGDRRA